ncbi:SDR family NAD(P)-dependent oxidoreductase [Acuticoccus kandeliae]|uniref:SDR family NAD(P)-dependent oxidoreductase n=1 Tax=Acuticoccus kandeliae TaxID=2073160 RepID=UPI000D3E1808|nr:SDR family NAD(P)-dependent oxidoreductase [Acuticoccus kandeliae]
MFNDLVDKRVLITGGSTGIGAELAIAFARAGARVGVVAHSNKAAGEEVVRAAREAGADAELFVADVSKTEACLGLVEAFVARFGGIDVLINNAGALLHRVGAEAVTDETYDAVLDLNVRSVIMMSRYAIPHLKAAGGGAIVNTGSIAGRDGGGIGSLLYAGSKAFVHDISRNMAKEFAADGIRVNTVAPGYIETPFHAATPAARKEAMTNSVAMKRPGTPAECVPIYLFFASNACSGYITGQIMDVNGGQYMP